MTKFENDYGFVARREPFRETSANKASRYRNEIDLVGEDALSARIDFYEIKRDGARINLEALRKKAIAFFTKNPEAKSLQRSFKALSLENL